MKTKSFKLEPAVFHTLNTIFLICVAIVTIYPMWNTLAISFNTGNDTMRGGIYLWPREWTMQNYESIFATGALVQAFFISVSRTLIATFASIFLTSMLAYTLSRKEYGLRKPITVIVVMTLYFNAGLIPYYFLIKDLNLLNSFLVYIIPGLVSAFNMLVVRTYIQTLPEGLIESAKIDGASEFAVFMKVILPLCRPVLATIALFVAVGQWNSWFDTFLFNSSNPDLSTLQYELMKLLSSTMQTNASASAINNAAGAAERVVVTPLSIRAAITMVASVPILLVYPFLQRHFVQGMQLGSMKE